MSLQKSEAQSPVTLAIEHATVLPMNRDTTLRDHTILISGQRIVWVGSATNARIPPDARRIDARDAWVIPGLADMHVHLDKVEELGEYVRAGITQKLAGYDMIKMIQRMSVASYRRLVETARANGMPVVGHVVSNIGLAQTLAAGQVSIEHVDGIRRTSRISNLVRDELKGFDGDAAAIARAGAWVGTIASAREGRCDPPTPQVTRIVASLKRARVKLLAGSDAGMAEVKAESGLQCELRTLVAAGLTPYEAIAAATSNAEAFASAHLARSRDPFGTVTVGARADLVVLDADPRVDIGAVARPRAVVLRGRLTAR